ncbi:MAG: [FeFe] hydrogenase, group A [Candidatus Pacebacteria bacterium]|nr:[FeFe] hydrogenase, group A [Candidatus Paceibacterota bacterium]
MKIQAIIDDKRIESEEGKTILEAAKDNGIKIPSLCFHSDLSPGASCRLCLVEIKGRKGLHTSCSVKLEHNMEIRTKSPEIEKARRINLELIFSQHIEECDDCLLKLNCELLRLADEFKVEITRFSDRKKKYPIYKFGPSLIFDSSKCIDCRNCVEVCHIQQADFLEVKKRGCFYEIVPSKNKKRDCIYCGQCLVHCPVGAFEAVGEFEDIEKPLKNKDKVVVFQFAPSIRTSIGEEFNLDYGAIVTEKLAAAIRRLGADKVFDVSVGADFTTYEEAKELVERLKGGKNLPMFTSCCPSWVKFVEFYYPKLIPNLTSVRSPHIISGALIKTYWAKRENINPKNIVVVSIMPCVAKKYEIRRKELKIKGIKPVDYVLTTRELAWLIRKRKIDIKNIKGEELDSALGMPSGSGIIYGATGGVMESALRQVSYNLLKQPIDIEFKKVRGMEGVKKAELSIGGGIIKAAVASGIGNAKRILDELKKNPKLYNYIEVMACPGGCIGGGGQPVPADKEIRRKRAESLYSIDDKKEIKTAGESPIVKRVYDEFLNNEKLIKDICHTRYFKKKKEVK